MIRVLTYNILADQNCFDSPGHVCRSYASYLSADILRKQRRLPLVLSEILSYQADIICLQEVDESVYERLFEPILVGHYNYQGYFSCKASDGTREGCATFWSLQAFEHVPIEDRKRHILRHVFTNEHRSQYKEEQEDWASMEVIQSLLACRPELRHVVTTVLGHILQLVPLTLKIRGASKSPIIWVANTHLYFHPLASHIRLIQMYAICHHMSRELKERYKRELKNNDCGSAPSIIMCGDFNSSLTNAVGKLLIDRQVPSNFRDLKKHLQQFHYRNSDNENNNGIPHADPLATEHGDGTDVDVPEIRLPAHFPRFQSALHEVPPVTHFIPGFSGTLDHILISENSNGNDSNDEEGTKMVSVRSAPMPSMRDVGRDTAMPSPVLPSDHVSLLVELRVSTSARKE
jgi:2',5'-phosphodiesterase